MRKILLTGLIFLINYISYSQTIYEEFKSEKLDEVRKIKIQLPRNYDTNTDKKYPIVLVLDGDYLFEPVAGNVDYYSYWEDMPESIVVGVLQGDGRYDDCSYDSTNFVPSEKGAQFFEFLGLELIPYIDKKYRTAKFIIAVGHDFTANFLNYYLFKSPPLFKGYINLSPDLAPMMEDRLVERIPDIKEKIFYYSATGTKDIQLLRESAERLNPRLKGLESEHFHYYYDNFDGATHYTVVGRGIPNAIEKIFAVYRPITIDEYNDVLLKLETPISEYLLDRYKTVTDLFGFESKIRKNDLLSTLSAAEKKLDWESVKEIANIARKEYPLSVISHYYLGRYYEETGKTRKAMKTYQGGFDKEEIDFITVDLLLERAEKIKNDFGY